MADETNICDTCGDGIVELLRKILSIERSNFDRLAQINQNIASSDLTTENSNINGINGVTPSVGCGVSTTGTLRVAQATDCVVTTSATSVTPGTGASNLGKAEDSPSASGDTGVLSLFVRNDTNATLTSTDLDYAAATVDLAGNSKVVGNLAHDAVDAGNPVKIGFQARTTLPTAVADADRTNGIADKFGRQVVQHSIRDLRGNQQTTITSSTAETTIVTASAAQMLDVYGLVIANTSATACAVTIKDSTAGTTRFIFMIPASDTRGFMLPACDGHKQAAVNNNWTATCGTSVASISITALFVQNPS